jgi:hypothetical protein
MYLSEGNNEKGDLMSKICFDASLDQTYGPQCFNMNM